MEVVGCKVCVRPGCSNLVLEHIAVRCGGLCVECISAGFLPHVRQAEIIARGRRIPIRFPARRDHGGAKGSKHTKHQADHAKRVAVKRLMALYPEVYELLLADERMKRRLEPFPIERGVSPIMEAAARSLGLERIYSALTVKGADTDATP